eukprot:1605225-Pyramimonas_sp.AAC.1
MVVFVPTLSVPISTVPNLDPAPLGDPRGLRSSTLNFWDRRWRRREGRLVADQRNPRGSPKADVHAAVAHSTLKGASKMGS